MLLSGLDCFNHEINYVGTVFKTIPGVNSAKDCQLICFGIDPCVRFSYNIITRNCVQFSSLTDMEMNTTSISGPNVCPNYLGTKSVIYYRLLRKNIN